MKKKIFTFLIVLVLMCGVNVKAEGPTASSGLTDSTCRAFADFFHTISKTEGSYYYKYCYRVGCNYGQYITTNMVMGGGFKCQNGNYNPYRRVTSNGCSAYTGSCNKVGGTYCTKVEFVDCNKTADGKTYVDPNEGGGTPTKPTKPTTTKKTTQSKKTKPKSSKKKTTNKTWWIGKTTKKTTSTSYITTTTTTTTTALSNNTNIKEIYVDKNQLGYTSSINEYNIQAEASVTNIDIEVILEDGKSTYKVTGNNNMPVDEDTSIKITVRAEDGTEKEVVINVMRYNISSSECFLSNIYIEGYDLNFSKSVYEYTLKLTQKEKALDINAVPLDETSYVEVVGNEKLKNNSKIKINITGADDSLCVYTITIKKPNNLWKLFIVIGLIVVGFGVAIFFIVKRLRKSKGKYKYE